MRRLPRPLLAILLVCGFGCDSATPPAKVETKAAKTADAKAKAPETTAPIAKAEPAPAKVDPVAPTTAVPVEPSPVEPPADPNADVVLDEGKEFYGLKVAEIDGWTPSFEVDRGGIEWSKKGNASISLGLSAKPIEKVEDIEFGFMAGTELSKQDPPTKTAKGWHTTVVTKDGKTTGFIYVRPIGKSWVVCDALLSRTEGDARPEVPTAKIVEICDSANP